MRRLEALQRRRGEGGGEGPSPHHAAKEPLISRSHARQEGLRRLAPLDGHGTIYAGPDMQRWEAESDKAVLPAEVHEELEVNSMGDSPAYHTFSSDEPNSKLLRNARGVSLRTGRNTARINNFVMSPPSSGNGTMGVLPAGSALQAARAAGHSRLGGHVHH